MHTTALVVQVGKHTASLYYSSHRHVGENLQELLDKRQAWLAKLLAMSDALRSNEVAHGIGIPLGPPQQMLHALVLHSRRL